MCICKYIYFLYYLIVIKYKRLYYKFFKIFHNDLKTYFEIFYYIIITEYFINI